MWYFSQILYVLLKNFPMLCREREVNVFSDALGGTIARMQELQYKNKRLIRRNLFVEMYKQVNITRLNAI